MKELRITDLCDFFECPRRLLFLAGKIKGPSFEPSAKLLEEALAVEDAVAEALEKGREAHDVAYVQRGVRESLRDAFNAYQKARELEHSDYASDMSPIAIFYSRDKRSEEALGALRHKVGGQGLIKVLLFLLLAGALAWLLFSCF